MRYEIFNLFEEIIRPFNGGEMASLKESRRRCSSAGYVRALQRETTGTYP
jgi:hypothetical protein